MDRPPDPPARPAAVSVASLLTLLAAAAVLTDGLVGMAHAEAVTGAFRQAYAGVEGASWSVANIMVAGSVLLLLASGLATLAILNSRRRARLHTWLLGAVTVCWGGSSVLTERRVPRNAPDPEQLQRLLDQAVPAWVGPLTRVTIVVAVAAVVAAMVLLATPRAGDYFRSAAPRTGGPDP